MRLWSLHPKYLDSLGLVALWREALLARKVLQGRTKGYRFHPQLARFRECRSPLRYINSYLFAVWREAQHRGYRFDKRKLRKVTMVKKLSVTQGQLKFEMLHLQKKLKRRDKRRFESLLNVRVPLPHPLFSVRKGGIERWEHAP